MERPSARPLAAFTLIELLIVVAIIAILAAIAVPNFLDAQVRAKVSRAKADMRSLATAIEAYYVDNNAYPIPVNPDTQTIDDPCSLESFECRNSFLLTTPISFMSKLPNEPFPAQDADEADPTYHYSTRDHFICFEGADTELVLWTETMVGAPIQIIQYYALSHGPDLDHDDPGGGNPALYDPTNGTNSNGDIVYFGPGTGFRN